MLFPIWSTVTALLLGANNVHAQYYPLTGTQTGRTQSGSRPSRQNILTMQNDITTFSLYIQALGRMQAAGENDPSSWFQIAGIHGRPYIPWNNVPNSLGAPQIGYCTHNSVLFTTWHRPYLALFEQILANHVQAIAKTYPPQIQATYQAAADRFRIPYWDWATNPLLPDVTIAPTIQIITPTGARVVDNPLFTYKFQTFPLNPAYFSSSDGHVQYRSTTRDNPNTINNRLRNEGFQRRTWTSIAKSRTFNSFSTAGTPGSSIESVHNSVHGDVGVHMSTLSQSAFDPILQVTLWLHHANIDRLFAIWQAINPNSYLTPMLETQGTFTIRAGEIDTSSTPLTPFTLNTAGQFFTSDSARYLSPFGYTYPEISDWNQSPDQLRANVTAQFNRLYNPTGTFTKKKRSSSNQRVPGSVLRTWSAGIAVSKLDLTTRIIIRLFMGEPPADPREWFESKSCVGSVFVHPMPNANGYYDNLRAEVKIVVHDEVDLDTALEGRGIDGQDVKVASEYLKKNLQWRIQSFDGPVIPTEKVPSLKIIVQEQTCTLARSITELPEYGKKVLHPEVTKGKAGGFTGTAAC